VYTYRQIHVSVLLPGFSKAVGTLEPNVNVCFDNMCRSINARQAKATWDATESQLTLTGLSNDFSSVLVKIVIDRSGHQETLVGSK